MNRNISKLVSEYDRQFLNNPCDNFDGFYASDFDKIEELSRAQGEGKSTLFYAIWNSLKVGYMIGHRAALKSQKKQAQAYK